LLAVFLTAFAWTLDAAPKAAPPALTEELRHPSGAFSFRTPTGWTARMLVDPSDVFEVAGDGLLVRFYFKPQEIGLDALHVSCMDLRLLGPMETAPEVRYDHDFVGGALGHRRLLDSAFDVRYDREVMGASEWRQRNLTLVGDGESLCAISYAPRARWRKSAETRALLDGILASLKFRE
jgi:hypothetical protein